MHHAIGWIPPPSTTLEKKLVDTAKLVGQIQWLPLTLGQQSTTNECWEPGHLHY